MSWNDDTNMELDTSANVGEMIDLLWCVRSELIFRNLKNKYNNKRRYYGVNKWVTDLENKPLNDVQYHLSKTLFHIVGHSDT